MTLCFLLTESNFYSKEAIKNYRKVGKVYNYSKKFKEFDKINVLIIRLSININKSFLHKFHNLKYILSPTTGLNHIDLNYCKKYSIKVISLNNVTKLIQNVNSTAELTIGLILSLNRNIVKANNKTKNNKEWTRYPYISDNIDSKSIGIIGMGRIGEKVAHICLSMGLKIYYYDTKKIITNKKFKRTSLKYLLKYSDIITLHLNYSCDNENFLNKEKINLIKKNCLIVNTARGEVIDEYYLLKRIKQNKILGYACDVISEEKNSKSLNKFLKSIKNIDNVIVTPHIGGFTRQSLNYTENLISNYFIKLITNNENISA